MNDSLIVRCTLSDGTVGWGEGLPRKYVTGETIESAWQHLVDLNVSPLALQLSNFPDLIDMLDHLHFSKPAGQRDCFGNSARCALEVAILDAYTRAVHAPLSNVLQYVPEAKEVLEDKSQVHYSAAITAMHPLKVRVRGLLVRANQFRQCKVKVGVAGANDAQLLKLIRWYLGRDMRIRIDANEAWRPTNVIAKMQPLLTFDISSLEQPVPQADIDQLADVRKELPVPIMLDESLCSYSDGQRAIEYGLCDIFNIRLSKCGGLIPSFKLLMLAKQNGMQAQLGCQVGETGILSAAGRHFACSVKGLVAVEGSFDRYLVRESLIQEDITFGYHGIGPVLTGIGLGVNVDEQAVERVSIKMQAIKVN